MTFVKASSSQRDIFKLMNSHTLAKNHSLALSEAVTSATLELAVSKFMYDFM